MSLQHAQTAVSIVVCPLELAWAALPALTCRPDPATVTRQSRAKSLTIRRLQLRHISVIQRLQWRHLYRFHGEFVRLVILMQHAQAAVTLALPPMAAPAAVLVLT